MAYYGKFKVDTDSAEVFLKDNEKIYNKKIISTLKAYRKNKAYEHLGLDGKGIRKSEAIIQN